MRYKRAQPKWQRHKANTAGDLTRTSNARSPRRRAGPAQNRSRSPGVWAGVPTVCRAGSSPPAASAPGVSVAELERRIRTLERENADLREQRTIPTKSRRHLLPRRRSSRSRAGNGDDNARMESFWATMKTELIDGRVYATRTEAKRALFWYIEVFDNRTRLHGARGFYSPVDFENRLNQNTINPALRLVLNPGARSRQPPLPTQPPTKADISRRPTDQKQPGPG